MFSHTEQSRFWFFVADDVLDPPFSGVRGHQDWSSSEEEVVQATLRTRFALLVIDVQHVPFENSPWIDNQSSRLPKAAPPWRVNRTDSIVGYNKCNRPTCTGLLSQDLKGEKQPLPRPEQRVCGVRGSVTDEIRTFR